MCITTTYQDMEDTNGLDSIEDGFVAYVRFSIFGCMPRLFGSWVVGILGHANADRQFYDVYGDGS
jgi:hypothetical protein